MQSRGPNTLNLNSYTRGPEKTSSSSPYNQTENITIEEKFDNYVKQIRQHEDLMTKMAKNISVMSQDNNFISDFYPNFALNCKYDNDEEKKVVSYNDISLNKILSTLQKGNSALKQEMKGWNFQFAKKTRLTETLISENKILRRYLSKKNKQIVQLLQQIKNAENSELTELDFTLNQLKQQNNILADHYKAIKQDLVSKNSEQVQLSKAIDSASLKSIELQMKMKQIEDREQHVGKFRVMGVENEKQYASREKYLLGERERLNKLKEQYRKDERDIMEQIDQCQIDKKDMQEYLQVKFDSHQKQKQELLGGIQQNSETYLQQLQQNKEKKQEIMMNENRLSQYSTMGRKMERKYKEYEQDFSQKQQERVQLIKQEGAMLSDLDLLDLEISQLREQLEQKKKHVSQLNNNQETELKTFAGLREQEINRWNKQLQVCKKSCNKRILEQTHAMELEQKEIANLQQQIQETNGYIQTLFEQIRQNKQKEAVANQLRNRLNAIQAHNQIRR